MRGQAKRGPVLFSSYGPQAIRGSGATEPTPDTRTRSQRASAVGFEVVSRSPRGPLSKPKPRPRRATPRKPQTAPRGGRGRNTGGCPPRGPTAPEARSDRRERRGPRAPGAHRPNARTAPQGRAPIILPRARTSVVSALKNGGVLRHPPMGDK